MPLDAPPSPPFLVMGHTSSPAPLSCSGQRTLALRESYIPFFLGGGLPLPLQGHDGGCGPGACADVRPGLHPPPPPGERAQKQSKMMERKHELAVLAREEIAHLKQQGYALVYTDGSAEWVQ